MKRRQKNNFLWVVFTFIFINAVMFFSHTGKVFAMTKQNVSPLSIFQGQNTPIAPMQPSSLAIVKEWQLRGNYEGPIATSSVQIVERVEVPGQTTIVREIVESPQIVQVIQPDHKQTAEIVLANISANISFLGNTIAGDEIVNNTIELGSKTTGNYLKNVSSGNGVAISGTEGEGWTATVDLGPLQSDWQTGNGYDVIFSNQNSEIKIKESSGDTYYATLDAGDLSTNTSYELSGPSGTVLTSANYSSHILSVGNTLQAASNLADLTDILEAKDNLGLGTGDSPLFSRLQLGAVSEQLTFGSGAVGVLSWEPTSDKTILLPDATTELVGNDTLQTLTNKTISGITNSVSNLANSALQNSSVNIVSGSGLDGGGAIALGGTLNLTNTGVLSLNSATGNVSLAAAGIANLNTVGNTVTITGTEADTLSSITQRGSDTLQAVSLNGGLTTTAANASSLGVTGNSSLGTQAGSTVTLGNATGALQVVSNGLNVSTGGAVSGISGYTQASGDFAISGTGTFSTGTGNTSLNGNTTVAVGRVLAVSSADSLTVGGVKVPQTLVVPVSLIASLLDQTIFIADADYQLAGTRCSYSIAALLNGALQVKVETGSQSPGSGIAQLTGAIDLSATTNSTITGTLIGSPTVLHAGDRLSLDISGVLTNLFGHCTLTLKRV
jgi:hypothetical protein